MVHSALFLTLLSQVIYPLINRMTDFNTPPPGQGEGNSFSQTLRKIWGGEGVGVVFLNAVVRFLSKWCQSDPLSRLLTSKLQIFLSPLSLSSTLSNSHQKSPLPSSLFERQGKRTAYETPSRPELREHSIGEEKKGMEKKKKYNTFPISFFLLTTSFPPFSRHSRTQKRHYTYIAFQARSRKKKLSGVSQNSLLSNPTQST